jgi:hypothetical protein
VSEEWVIHEDSDIKEQSMALEVYGHYRWSPRRRIGQCDPVLGEWIDSKEWERDFFYLRMTKYEFRHIPTPDGRMSRDPALDWDLGD